MNTRRGTVTPWKRLPGRRNGQGCLLVPILAAGLVAAGASGAHAQQGGGSAAERDPADEDVVVVTGTRLKAETASPVAVLESADIERAAALTLEVALNRMPQVTPSYSASANNPAVNGASYVDLRGLGIGRNLVLLDGRRIVGANASNSVDLNTIPTALVERVEVLTGGAAAVYGADAISGAVNIIMRDEFEGWRLDGRTLVSELGDGRQHSLSLAAGWRLPAGSIMGHVGWAGREEIGKGAREFSAQASSVTTFLPGGAYLVGPNTPSQAAVDQVFARYGVAAGLVSNRGGPAGFVFNPDGTLLAPGVPGIGTFDAQNVRTPPQDTATAFFPDVYSYNFEPFNKLVLPLDRTSAAVLGDYDLSDGLSIYGRALWTRYTAATALAPTPAPTDPNPLYPGLQVLAFTIPVTNPFIPADLAQLLASRTGNSPALAGSGPNEEFQYRFRTTELGARQSSNEADFVQLQGGFSLDLDEGWVVKADFGAGRYDRSELREGLLAVRRFEQLLDSPTGGTELCAGGLNPFGAGINDACREFLGVSVRYSTEIELKTATATIEPPPVELPAGNLRSIVGLERRAVDYVFTPPPGFAPGEVSGFIPLTALSGGIRTTDLFLEVAAPLTSSENLIGAWDFTVGYRGSLEDGADMANSAKGELSWKPVSQLRVRGSLQRAIRAADIFERFQPPVAGFATVLDPCAAGNPSRTAAVLDFCRRQAVALGFSSTYLDTFTQPDTELRSVNSGNPGLLPEIADTATAGMVWRPDWGTPWAEDASFSIDWYSIDISDAIGYADPQIVVNRCYNIGGQTNPNLDIASPGCTGFLRSSVDFTLTNISAPRSNQASVLTSGLDIAANIRTDLSAIAGASWAGSVETRFMASYLDIFEEKTSPLQDRIDFAGTISGSSFAYHSLPRWRGQFGFNWMSGPFELDFAARYVGPMEHGARRINPAAVATGVGSAIYWDMTASWSLDSGAELRAGVLNLFDRGPELFTPATDANTDPSTYDVVGRRFWVSISFRS